MIICLFDTKLIINCEFVPDNNKWFNHAYYFQGLEHLQHHIN